MRNGFLSGVFSGVWLCWILAVSPSHADAQIAFRDGFTSGELAGWQAEEGQWEVRDGQVVAEGEFSTLLREESLGQDFEIAADVAYSHDGAHAAAGILFRMGDDATGYAACLREIEKGNHPEFGPWERPVVQLFRKDRDGLKLLQESKVMGCRSGLLRRLKVVCQGPNTWVFYEDMETPVLTEYDAQYVRAGRVGLWKDHLGDAFFDNVQLASVGPTPEAPLRIDWSEVRGAVYVRSNAVNSVQMWQDYWPHTEMIDRELSYAALYGFNMVQVYLHWIVWDEHKEEYLDRVEDFLGRASRHGLQVNFILWDDQGHVEPSLTFADPVPGRHNSQMMPNPSHQIRDSETAMRAHRDQFREYVEGITGYFKDDDRIAFWQLYNEAIGPKEQYRVGEADANLNRLLAWTRDWIKETGTRIPVTATGGGFYGPKYSDFYTYHSYGNGEHPLPNADGGPEHLCTETLNRPYADLVDYLRELAGKDNGFVVWELMIGRDNCRFPWGHPDGLSEPAAPFHGVIYPDGHPWDLGEVEALLGEAAFAALSRNLFQVEYFDGNFQTLKKTSLTPRIDFDLGDEHGYGSPDASAAIGKDNFSIRWTGRLVTPATGSYTFEADCDGSLGIWIDQAQVIAKDDHHRRTVQGAIDLVGGQSYQVRIEYMHRDGAASSHVYWSGPSVERRIFMLGGDSRPVSATAEPLGGLGKARKIYAHYMGNYPVAHGGTNYHRHIEAPKLRHDQPAHPNLAAWRNFALVPENLSLSLEQSMDLEIRRALRAGIDGFAVDMWSGGEKECKEVIAAMFKVAEERDYPFEITLCWDTPWQDSGDQASQLRWWLETYGKSPKMGRFNGLPVMLGYYSVGKASNYAAQQMGEPIAPQHHLNPSPRVRATPEGWKLMAQRFRELERQVGQPIYWHFCIEGLFMQVDDLDQHQLEQTKLVPAVRTFAEAGFAIGKFLGFDDPEIEDKLARAVRAVGGQWSQPMWIQYDNAVNGFRFGGFEGTTRLRQNWRKARQYDSRLLQFVTWNDYTENTNLAPAYQTHYSLYDLNSYFIRWWKNGAPPQVGHDHIYLTYRRYPKGAKTFPFDQRPYSDVNSVLEVVTILPTAASIRLPGRDIEYRAEPGLFVQQFPFTPGPVVAEVLRGGKVQTRLESPDPITDKPFREQLNLYSFSTEEAHHWEADFGELPLQTYSEYGDVDQDGLPNWFEMYWFGEFLDWSTATGAYPSADPDGDGKTNLEEHREQTDPTQP